MAVYSTQFYLGPVASGTLVTLGPWEQLAILRDIELFASDVDNGLLLFNAAYTIVMAVPCGTPFSSYYVGQWQGRVVLPPGQQVELDAVTGTLGVAVSGYLLSP